MAGSLSERSRWAIARLKSMPPAELPHRVREQVRRRMDRGGGLARAAVSLPSSLLEAPPPAWPVDAAALAGLPPAALERLADDASALLGGDFTMLGQTWPRGARVDWTLDPDTGTRWPSGIYTFDVDFRHGTQGRDVKLAWELGRLQHLQLLAAAWRLLGDERALEACLEDVGAWIADNRPYEGIGYASGIELGCRVLSLLVIAGLVGPERIEGALRADLWRTLAAHGAWLERYPSLYSSANNHRVAELGGLIALGALAPALPGAARWLADARAELDREARRQLHPDGVGAEQSPTYQAFTMEWMLAARVAAAGAGLAPDRRADARLAAGAEFLAALADAGGHVPQIGDDDEGVVFRCGLGPEHAPPHPLSVAASAAGLLDRPDLCPAAAPLDLRAALLGLGARPEARYRPRPRLFPYGGYTVLHSALRAPDGVRERLLVFDHAPLGMGPLNAHGHADALALWLHLDGRPVLGEAGTFRYNGAPDWRRWARGALAHNALVVDGREPSKQSGGFGWSRVARVTAVRSRPGQGEVEATQDGFRALGVIHRRRARLSPLQLVVEDHLEGAGSHEICIAWHFAADLEVTRDGGGWVARRGGVEILRLSPPERLVGRVVRQQGAAGGAPAPAGFEPGPGVNAPAYNHLQPACTLLLEGRVELPARLSAIFAFS
jgi:hypothetical protein